jgi:hypothetical protein
VKFRKIEVDEKKKAANRHNAQIGGSILKVKKKKRSPKDENAIAAHLHNAQIGGSVKKRKRYGYHSKLHERLHEGLSGKGGRLDPPFVRRHMAEIMKNYHPSIAKTYFSGKPHVEPTFSIDHNHVTPSGTDTSADVLQMGGSMLPVSHCEDGYLVYHDDTHHPYNEVV